MNAGRRMIFAVGLLGAMTAHAGGVPPLFSKEFDADTVSSGDVSRLIYTIDNIDVTALTDMAFVETLPAGVSVAGLPDLANSCDGVLQVNDAGDNISFEAGRLPSGESCEIALNVTATGDMLYTVTSGDLTSSSGNSGPSSADLTAMSSAPSISASFAPGSVLIGNAATLAVNIDNSLGGPAIGALDLSIVLPPGLMLADPDNFATGCGGTATLTGNQIDLAGGSIAMGIACSLSLSVTGQYPGHRTLTSEPMMANGMAFGRATAEIEILRPTLALDKRFLVGPANEMPAQLPDLPPEPANPAGVPLLSVLTQDAPVNGTSRLGLMLDNTANGAQFVTAPVTLAQGLLTAPVLNLTNSCGTLFQGPTPGAIGFMIAVQIPAGVMCEVAFDLQPTRAGEYVVTLNSGGSWPEFTGRGFITARRGVGPGDVVDLAFNIMNLDRADTATNITFSDDLDAMLSGAMALALPPNPCGAGSSLSGSSLVSLNNGTLNPGAECSFTVAVAIPPAATPGEYLNTTSTITADVGGHMVADPAASDDVSVFDRPSFSKTFLTNPAVPGDLVSIEYTVTNNSATDSLTEIAFTDPINDIAAQGSIVVPAAGFCNGASANVQVANEFATVQVSGGTLAPSANCSFSVDFNPTPNPQQTAMESTTSWLTGRINSVSVAAPPASDTLQIISGPKLSLTVLSPTSVPGSPVDLVFDLAMRGDDSQGASDIDFTLDLSAAIPGLVSVNTPIADACGAGSMLADTGGTLLTFTDGALAPGERCIFSATLQIPAGASEGEYLLTTSSPTAMASGFATSSPAASETLSISLLTTQLSFDAAEALPGDTVMATLTLDYTAGSTGTASATLEVDLDSFIPGAMHPTENLSDICGTGSFLISDADRIFVINANTAAGTSCSVTRAVSIPANTVPGDYQANLLGTNAMFGGGSGAATLPTSQAVLTIPERVVVSMAVDSPLAAGDTGILSLTLMNPTASAVSDVALITDLSAAIPGMVSISPGQNDACGMGSTFSGSDTLFLSNASLPAMGQCQLNVDIMLPGSAAPGDFVIMTDTPTVAGIVAGGAGSATLSVRTPTPLAIDNDSVSVDEGGTATNRGTIARNSSTVSLSASVGQVVDLGGDRFQWNLATSDGPDETQMVTIFSATSRGGGVQDSVTFQINVDNLPPGMVAEGLLTFTPGNPYTLTLAEVVDPGQDTASQFNIRWGDGQTDSVNSLGDVMHTYVTSATSVTVHIDITDEDGTFMDALTFQLFNADEVPFYDSFEDELNFNERVRFTD